MTKEELEKQNQLLKEVIEDMNASVQDVMTYNQSSQLYRHAVIQYMSTWRRFQKEVSR